MSELTLEEKARIKHSLKVAAIDGAKSTLCLRDVATIEFDVEDDSIVIRFCIQENHSQRVTIESFRTPTMTLVGKTRLYIEDQLIEAYNYDRSLVYTEEDNNVYQTTVRTENISN